MKLVVFEDNQFEQFLPLAWLRGVFELKSGATSMVQKIERAAGVAADALLVRDYLAKVVGKRYPNAAVNSLAKCKGQETLLVNGRVCGVDWKLPAVNTAVWKGERLAAWRTTSDVSGLKDYAAVVAAAKAATKVDFAGTWFEYVWDMMLANPGQITADFKAAGKTGIHGKMSELATVYGSKDQVFIGDGAEIHPFVCIDTHGGPVTIEAGAVVHPFTRIEGPCYIGPKCMILGAKIREGCSLGPMCRVGGEVEESIIHGYSNKYHDGFLGHAYVGEWVNLGALFTNSDLKNDYTSVSVYQNGRMVDTGSNKVGAMIGDHVKASIGTLLNTGTIVGTMALLVATGCPMPKYIPAFSWFLTGANTKGFGLKSLLATAKTATGRRKVEFTADDEALIHHVYELNKEELSEYVKKDRRKAAK